MPCPKILFTAYCSISDPAPSLPGRYILTEVTSSAHCEVHHWAGRGCSSYTQNAELLILYHLVHAQSTHYGSSLYCNIDCDSSPILSPLLVIKSRVEGDKLISVILSKPKLYFISTLNNQICIPPNHPPPTNLILALSQLLMKKLKPFHLRGWVRIHPTKKQYCFLQCFLLCKHVISLFDF